MNAAVRGMTEFGYLLERVRLMVLLNPMCAAFVASISVALSQV